MAHRQAGADTIASKEVVAYLLAERDVECLHLFGKIVTLNVYYIFLGYTSSSGDSAAVKESVVKLALLMHAKQQLSHVLPREKGGEGIAKSSTGIHMLRT